MEKELWWLLHPWCLFFQKLVYISSLPSALFFHLRSHYPSIKLLLQLKSVQSGFSSMCNQIVLANINKDRRRITPVAFFILIFHVYSSMVLYVYNFYWLWNLPIHYRGTIGYILSIHSLLLLLREKLFVRVFTSFPHGHPNLGKDDSSHCHAWHFPSNCVLKPIPLQGKTCIL